MARDFSKTASNNAAFGAGAVGAHLNGLGAFSVAIWAWPDAFSTGANNNRLLTVAVDGVSAGVLLSLPTASPNFEVRVRSQAGDTLTQNTGTTNVTTGSWWHFGAAINIAGDFVTPYVNGTAEGGAAATFTASAWTLGTPTVADMIGADDDTPSTAAQFDGALAELAFFPRLLAAGEFAAMARGVSPSRFGPRLYYPMMRDGSTIADLARGGPAATVTGTIGWRAHAPTGMAFAQRAKSTPYVVSAPGATAVPVFVHHYRQQGVA